MNHYAKLAITAIRLVAVTLFLWSLLGLVSGFLGLLGQVEPAAINQETLMISVLWMIGSAFLYGFSGRLGIMITRSLGD